MKTPIWVYEAAFPTLEAARQLIEAHVAEVRRVLIASDPNQATRIPKTSRPSKAKRHAMSAEGRAAIAHAQRKRWAKYHKDRKKEA